MRTRLRVAGRIATESFLHPFSTSIISVDDQGKVDVVRFRQPRTATTGDGRDYWRRHQSFLKRSGVRAVMYGAVVAALTLNPVLGLLWGAGSYALATLQPTIGEGLLRIKDRLRRARGLEPARPSLTALRVGRGVGNALAAVGLIAMFFTPIGLPLLVAGAIRLYVSNAVGVADVVREQRSGTTTPAPPSIVRLHPTERNVTGHAQAQREVNLSVPQAIAPGPDRSVDR